MSQYSRNRRQRKRGSAGKKIVGVLLGVLSLIALAIGGLGLWVLNVAADAPDIDTLHPASDGANSQIFDAAGNSLGYVQSDILREPVKLDEIPKDLQEGTIAIEDSNFYEHGGVDYAAIVRAAFANAEAGEVRQGASTITQQLVRNLYIDNPQDDIERKIQEAKMAQQYEDEHSKDQILDAYLNTATYGTNLGKSAVGVQAAAEDFFNKDVKDLGLRESALLAGLPQAPSEYNPLHQPQRCDRTAQRGPRRDGEPGLHHPGQGRVGQEGGSRPRTRHEVHDPFPAVLLRLRPERIDRQIRTEDRAPGRPQGLYDAEPDRSGGGRAGDRQRPAGHSGAARALVSTDTNTGAIIAMASSQSYDTSQFNLAADGERQPGSSFKPFVLTTAVDQGIDPNTTTYPAPSTITLSSPGQRALDGGQAEPAVRSRLANATANSVNTVFAQLGIDVGPENFTDMAHKLGITSDLQGVPAEALGGTSTCCTVLEMSNAYATIANGGVHHDPTAIRKVVFPNGDVDEPENPEGKRVISDGVAYTVATVMEGTLDFGTAAGYDLPGCTASGKTGTTEEQSDAWFVGYTPDVVDGRLDR